MGTPGIILTSKYSLPNSKDFTSYVNYLTREKALLDKEVLKQSDINELKRMNNAKSLLFDTPGQGKNSDINIDQKSIEANKILDNKFDLNSFADKDFTKMIGYMARKYAIERKSTQTLAEKIELKKVSGAIEELNSSTDVASDNTLLNGVFSQSQNFVAKNDLDMIKDKFLEGQKNGSVMYQDVISFDNKFLKQNGLLDNRGNLNEQRLKDASKSMMNKMFGIEELQNTGYWFASIHRNTKHVHIHFATVEKNNTRNIVEVERNGKIYYEPKGKRRLNTLDKMKSEFASSLLDRNDQLQRISELRNSLVEDIKSEFSNPKTARTLDLMSKTYKSLPKNKSDWNYGSTNKFSHKQIDLTARNNLNNLTYNLVKDNPKFKDYCTAVKKEGNFNKFLYGDSTRDNKDYEKNKMVDIQKRLGNSVLSEFKKSDQRLLQMNQVFGNGATRHYDNMKLPGRKFTPQLIYHLKRNISDVEQQRNEQVYAQMQKAVEYER